MKVILKYANGAEQTLDMRAQPHPAVFGMHMPEGIVFWFYQSDELPSGSLLYTETTEEEAHRIWHEE
jgi:hypothetical protein